MAINQGYPQGYSAPEQDLGPLAQFSQNHPGLSSAWNATGIFNPLARLTMLGSGIGKYTGAIKGQYDKAGAWTQAGLDTVDKQIGDLGSYFKRESSTPFFQTEAGAAALQQLRKMLSETLVGQQNNAVTGGATQESQLAGRKQATSQYGDAISKLTGYGTDRKDQLARDYQYRLGQWLQNKLALQQGQAQGHSTAAQNLIQAPFQLADSLFSNAQGIGSLLSGLG